MEKTIALKGLEAAAALLVRRGYEILDEFWEWDEGEYGIVASDEDGVLAFVPVRVNAFGADADDVDLKFPDEPGRAELEPAMQEWVFANESGPVMIRFDSIGILVFGDKAIVRHHLNLFRFCE